MACRADGDTLGDPVLDTAEPAYDGCRDGSRDSRDRDGDDGDGGDAPDLLGDDGTHGNRYGLGQQREHERAAEAEQFGEEDDARNGGEAPDGDAREDGFPELLELGDLPI